MGGESAIPWLDRARAARVDFSAVAGPVLVIGGGCDRIVPGRLARHVAAHPVWRRGRADQSPGGGAAVVRQLRDCTHLRQP